MDNTTVQSYDPLRKARISHPGSMIMRTNTATNAANDIVLQGVESKSWYVCFAGWRVGGGNINAANELAVTMSDGANVVYRSLMAKNSVEGLSASQTFAIPIKFTEGNTVTLHIDASGIEGTYIVHNVGAYLA